MHLKWNLYDASSDNAIESFLYWRMKPVFNWCSPEARFWLNGSKAWINLKIYLNIFQYSKSSWNYHVCPRLTNEILTGTPVSTLFYYYEQNLTWRIYGEWNGVMGRPINFASIENSEISHLACAHKQGGLAEQGKNLNWLSIWGRSSQYSYRKSCEFEINTTPYKKDGVYDKVQVCTIQYFFKGDIF